MNPLEMPAVLTPVPLVAVTLKVNVVFFGRPLMEQFGAPLLAQDFPATSTSPCQAVTE